MSIAIVTVSTLFMKSFTKCEKGYSLILNQLIIGIFTHQNKVMNRLLIIVSGCPIAYDHGFVYEVSTKYAVLGSNVKSSFLTNDGGGNKI